MFVWVCRALGGKLKPFSFDDLNLVALYWKNEGYSNGGVGDEETDKSYLGIMGMKMEFVEGMKMMG